MGVLDEPEPTAGDVLQDTIRYHACPSCEVTVLDMHNAHVASRAKTLWVRSVPAMVIDGKLADCCSSRGPDETALKAAGLGEPAS